MVKKTLSKTDNTVVDNTMKVSKTMICLLK